MSEENREDEKKEITEESEQYKRLKDLAERKFGSLIKMARLLNKNENTFYQYKNTDFGYKTLKLLEDNFSINPKYILYGEKPEFIIGGTIRDSVEIYDLSQTEGEIEMYEITTYAGKGVSMSSTPIGTVNIINAFNLKNSFLWHSNTNQFIGYGIEAGDMVIFERTNKVYPDDIILFETNGKEFLKKLKLEVDDTYVFINDEEIPILIKDVNIYGKVHKIIKRAK